MKKPYGAKVGDYFDFGERQTNANPKRGRTEGKKEIMDQMILLIPNPTRADELKDAPEYEDAQGNLDLRAGYEMGFQEGVAWARDRAAVSFGESALVSMRELDALNKAVHILSDWGFSGSNHKWIEARINAINTIAAIRLGSKDAKANPCA
jgi:hypothetical protein